MIDLLILIPNLHALTAVHPHGATRLDRIDIAAHPT